MPPVRDVSPSELEAAVALLLLRYFVIVHPRDDQTSNNPQPILPSDDVMMVPAAADTAPSRHVVEVKVTSEPNRSRPSIEPSSETVVTLPNCRERSRRIKRDHRARLNKTSKSCTTIPDDGIEEYKLVRACNNVTSKRVSIDEDTRSNKIKYSSKTIRTVNSCTNDMVPIGNGHARVPSSLLKRLDWSSYTNVTRKLLTAVFSRRVLATHSLTGKQSPAFPNKTAKKKLNADIVNDIIQTVVERCQVAENLVRVSITTKCADESKMLRNRQQNHKKRRGSVLENVPPLDSENSS